MLMMINQCERKKMQEPPSVIVRFKERMIPNQTIMIQWSPHALHEANAS